MIGSVQNDHTALHLNQANNARASPHVIEVDMQAVPDFVQSIVDMSNVIPRKNIKGQKITNPSALIASNISKKYGDGAASPIVFKFIEKASNNIHFYTRTEEEANGILEFVQKIIDEITTPALVHLLITNTHQATMPILTSCMNTLGDVINIKYHVDKNSNRESPLPFGPNATVIIRPHTTASEIPPSIELRVKDTSGKITLCMLGVQGREHSGGQYYPIVHNPAPAKNPNHPHLPTPPPEAPAFVPAHTPLLVEPNNVDTPQLTPTLHYPPTHIPAPLTHKPAPQTPIAKPNIMHNCTHHNAPSVPVNNIPAPTPTSNLTTTTPTNRKAMPCAFVDGNNSYNALPVDPNPDLDDEDDIPGLYIDPAFIPLFSAEYLMQNPALGKTKMPTYDNTEPYDGPLDAYSLSLDPRLHAMDEFNEEIQLQQHEKDSPGADFQECLDCFFPTFDPLCVLAWPELILNHKFFRTGLFLNWLMYAIFRQYPSMIHQLAEAPREYAPCLLNTLTLQAAILYILYRDLTPGPHRPAPFGTLPDHISFTTFVNMPGSYTDMEEAVLHFSRELAIHWQDRADSTLFEPLRHFISIANHMLNNNTPETCTPIDPPTTGITPMLVSSSRPQSPTSSNNDEQDSDMDFPAQKKNKGKKKKKTASDPPPPTSISPKKVAYAAKEKSKKNKNRTQQKLKNDQLPAASLETTSMDNTEMVNIEMPQKSPTVSTATVQHSPENHDDHRILFVPQVPESGDAKELRDVSSSGTNGKIKIPRQDQSTSPPAHANSNAANDTEVANTETLQESTTSLTNTALQPKNHGDHRILFVPQVPQSGDAMGLPDAYSAKGETKTHQDQPSIPYNDNSDRPLINSLETTATEPCRPDPSTCRNAYSSDSADWADAEKNADYPSRRIREAQKLSQRTPSAPLTMKMRSAKT